MAGRARSEQSSSCQHSWFEANLVKPVKWSSSIILGPAVAASSEILLVESMKWPGVHGCKIHALRGAKKERDTRGIQAQELAGVVSQC